ncbi:MAG: ferritin-like domain-containing protein [Alphaproteobacteria bacterium]|nr:ferritin-like domain-containing protein [Alphaproteobacteria bacterium]
MGNMARRISKTDVNDLIKTLNEAYAEEWLAYYQYFIGAKLAAGMLRPNVQKEFEEHAHQEFEHAGMLADRIIELGGTPVLNPDDFSKLAKCKYDEPLNEDTLSLVKQNLDAERCAIGRYQGICDTTFGKDYVTYRLSAHILKEEIEHEQEMEDFLKDMEIMQNLKQNS